MFGIHYPYTDAHQLNLDWILNEIKNLKEMSPDPATGFNIEKYGAVGDGLTDNTDALLEVIHDANGQPIYIPEGVFYSNIVTEIKKPVTFYGPGKLVNFKYINMHVPYNNYQNNPDWKDEYFRAFGVSFENLQITNQVQSSIILSAKLVNCNFTGQTALLMQNCIESSIINCNFAQCMNGIQMEGCTNILITGCNFTAISGNGANITEYSARNTRVGGENIKFIGCTFIDGVTGIRSYKSNWLWIDSCMLDYLNNCVSIEGGLGFKITNSYLANEATNRTRHDYYISPRAVVAVYVTAITPNYPVGGIIDNCDLVSYNTSANPALVVNGMQNYLLERLHITNCRFWDDAGNSITLARLSHGRDIYFQGNILTSPNNTSMVYCFEITDTMRIYCDHNDWRVCYNGNTVHGPNTYDSSNMMTEYAQLEVTGNGTAETEAVSYTVQNLYLNNHPKAVLSIGECSNVSAGNLYAYMDIQDAQKIFIKVKTLDGSNIPSDATIQINMVVFGSLNK